MSRDNSSAWLCKPFSVICLRNADLKLKFRPNERFWRRFLYKKVKFHLVCTGRNLFIASSLAWQLVWKVNITYPDGCERALRVSFTTIRTCRCLNHSFYSRYSRVFFPATRDWELSFILAIQAENVSKMLLCSIHSRFSSLCYRFSINIHFTSKPNFFCVNIWPL